MGVIDHPFNPLALCLGASGTFIARTMDRDPVHLRTMLLRANKHKGTSLLEIYQNCNVFNDGAFEIFTEKSSKKEQTLFLEHGKPLIFGATNEKGIRLNGFTPEVVNLSDVSVNDLWIHDERDLGKATLLVRFFDDPNKPEHLPRPFGVFYEEDRACYEDLLNDQIKQAIAQKGNGDLDALIKGKNTWEVK
jgi:2-oxoglutarate/2-oxoacid ferredoxin oxidoreductase subunit beta